MSEIANLPTKKPKNQFFLDRDAVKKALGKVNTQILSRFGSFVMRTAKQSMRRRKKPSAPGTPPSAHSKDAQHPYGPLLKTLYRYEFDPTTKSVVIGPKGKTNIAGPTLQEYGGNKIIKTRIFTEKSGKRATPAQAEAFRRGIANGRIILTKRPTHQKSVHLPARPYSRPALAENLPKFPTLYAGKITA